MLISGEAFYIHWLISLQNFTKINSDNDEKNELNYGNGTR